MRKNIQRASNKKMRVLKTKEDTMKDMVVVIETYYNEIITKYAK